MSTIPTAGSHIRVKYANGMIGRSVIDTIQEVTDTDHGVIQNEYDNASTTGVRVWFNWQGPSDSSAHRYYTSEWENIVDGETLTVSDTVSRSEHVRGGVTVPANATYDELLAIIETTGNDWAETARQYQSATHRAESAEQRFATRDTQFRDSIKTISDRLNEEARTRGWCDEFNRIIAETNDLLPVYELEGGEREFNVTWTETYTVNVSRSGTYTAVDGEAAEEMAREEDSDSDQLMDAIRYGHYEFDTSDDFDVEEA